MKNIFVILSLILLSCSSTKNNDNKSVETYNISPVTLIANPEKYHKKRVRIEGYFSYQREESALYLNKADFDNVLFKNSVYIYISPEIFEKYKINKPYKGFMSIEGVYDKNDNGHGGLFSGSIKSIEYIHRLFKRDSETDEYNIQ